MYKTRYTPTKWSRSLAKRMAPLLRMRWMHWLDSRNTKCGEPVVQSGGPVVSLTTFEPRWARVHYTLESIGVGLLKPSRLLLWVAPSVLQLGMPEALRRLQSRGVEILPCEDIGPHKKYFPAVNVLASDIPLVTADDDVLYPLDWLERLSAAAVRLPGCVVAHRARTIALLPAGGLAPYSQWAHCHSAMPSPLHMAVGIGGVLYPPVMQQALRQAGDGFRNSCPRADDVWLKAIALRHGVDVAQVADMAPFLIDVPGMRESGLARHNVNEGGNDAQIRATFTDDDVEILRGAAVCRMAVTERTR
jgi:hypothetical protein